MKDRKSCTEGRCTKTFIHYLDKFIPPKILCSVIFDLLLEHPCETDNGGCQQKCNIKGKEFACSCKKGFQLAEDGKACEKGENK